MFVCAATSLRALHAAGIVHGDVRGSNIVFAPDLACSCAPAVPAASSPGPRGAAGCCLRAQWLDFDFSREAGVPYPAVLADVHDGVRHLAAQTPGEPMRPAHDWFALAGLMRMYRAGAEKAAEWAAAAAAVERGEVPALPLAFELALESPAAAVEAFNGLFVAPQRKRKAPGAGGSERS